MSRYTPQTSSWLCNPPVGVRSLQTHRTFRQDNRRLRTRFARAAAAIKAHRSNPPPPRSGPRGWGGRRGMRVTPDRAPARCLCQRGPAGSRVRAAPRPAGYFGRPPSPAVRSAGRCRRAACPAPAARPSGAGRDPRASPRRGPPDPESPEQGAALPVEPLPRVFLPLVQLGPFLPCPALQPPASQPAPVLDPLAKLRLGTPPGRHVDPLRAGWHRRAPRPPGLHALAAFARTPVPPSGHAPRRGPISHRPG